MKKIIGFLMCVCVMIICTSHVFAAEVSDNFNMDDDITEIKRIITDDEVCSWSGQQNTMIDYSYIFPVYVTMDISESDTLEDTLEFANRYIAPVIDESGNCCGMVSIYLLRGEKWVIGRYTTGVDFISAIEQHGIVSESQSFYFIEIPQLGGDYGFLSVLNEEERYISIAKKETTISVESENMLEMIKDTVQMSGTDTDGSGMVKDEIQIYFVIVVAILFCAVFMTVYLIRKNHNVM